MMISGVAKVAARAPFGALIDWTRWKPFIALLPNHRQAWLTAAMASTLAGNFTIVGSVANLIGVQRARAQKIDISFWEYFRIGAPLTLLTIGVGILWLTLH